LFALEARQLHQDTLFVANACQALTKNLSDLPAVFQTAGIKTALLRVTPLFVQECYPAANIFECYDRQCGTAYILYDSYYG